MNLDKKNPYFSRKFKASTGDNTSKYFNFDVYVLRHKVGDSLQMKDGKEGKRISIA